jgi:hypothetical protein
MVLDIQTVHHILKKYSSSKCKRTVCLHTDLTSTLTNIVALVMLHILQLIELTNVTFSFTFSLFLPDYFCCLCWSITVWKFSLACSLNGFGHKYSLLHAAQWLSIHFFYISCFPSQCRCVYLFLTVVFCRLLLDQQGECAWYIYYRNDRTMKV